jgi:hypothetical protein
MDFKYIDDSFDSMFRADKAGEIVGSVAQTPERNQRKILPMVERMGKTYNI